MTKSAQPSYEVHEHIFVSGPRSNGMFIQKTQKTTSHFSHSHPGGDQPHRHEHTGPASYTIDQDDWFRATGTRGAAGSRKRYTAKPSGEQLPIRELEDWQKSFKVVVCDPPPGFVGTGGGDLAAARMALTFRMRPRVIDGRRRKR